MAHDPLRQPGIGRDLLVVARRGVAVATGVAGAAAVVYDALAVVVGLLTGQRWGVGAVAVVVGLALAGLVLVGIAAVVWPNLRLSADARIADSGPAPRRDWID